MKLLHKTILIFSFLLFFSVPLYAQETSEAKQIDEETKAICNKIIRNIYYDVLDSKGRYKELADFSEDALYENKEGILTIVYQFGDENLEKKDPRKDPYAFGVTIDKMNDKTFGEQEGSFAYGFAALGLKISGYQRKHLIRTQYDILPLIHKYGILLANHQQKYITLQLSMTTDKETFSTREDIYFDVTLKNVSKRHMVVKAMNKDTMYFLINNEFWGTRPESTKASSGKQIILKSGEEVTTRFKGESFQYPQDIEIRAVYRILIDGVNPSTTLKIKIIE